MLPFLPSVTTQDGSIPLPSKDWLDSTSLATASSKISQSPLFLSSIEIHTFTGSFPRALKFTRLLPLKTKPKTQTKKTQNNSPLDLVFFFSGLLLFFPHFKATFSNSRMYLLSPLPHSSHHCSPDFTPTPMKLLTEFMKWHQKSNRHFQALSFLLLSIQHSWAFDYLFQKFSSFGFCDAHTPYWYLAFPVSHSQLSLPVPPSLLDYYTLVFQSLDFILPTLFLCDLMNSQISDTIYVQNSFQIFIFSQGRLRNSRLFCSNMYF